MAERPDKLLFTPGPLTTSRSVKQAMLRDLGSRDVEFMQIVREVRERLLALAGVSQQQGFEAIPMQGSGTFGLEAVLGSVVARDGRLLVVANGAYGERLARIGEVLAIPTQVLRVPEDRRPGPEELRDALRAGPGASHVAMVHCETSSGMLNEVTPMGDVCREAGCRFIVDSMSAFGAVPVDLERDGIDYLISSANKCIEGVPGFSFVLCRRDALLEDGKAPRSLSLDLVAQWQELERSGQFRFTPPTHALLAFARALDELDAEGGVAGRAARYADNHRCLQRGMRRLGFREFLPEPLQSDVITAFRFPEDPAFDFDEIYRRLAERGFVIYPGKLTEAPCFRIGTVGRLQKADVEGLLESLRDVLEELGVRPVVPGPD